MHDITRKVADYTLSCYSHTSCHIHNPYETYMHVTQSDVNLQFVLPAQIPPLWVVYGKRFSSHDYCESLRSVARVLRGICLRFRVAPLQTREFSFATLSGPPDSKYTKHNIIDLMVSMYIYVYMFMLICSLYIYIYIYM